MLALVAFSVWAGGSEHLKLEVDGVAVFAELTGEDIFSGSDTAEAFLAGCDFGFLTCRFASKD